MKRKTFLISGSLKASLVALVAMALATVPLVSKAVTAVPDGAGAGIIQANALTVPTATFEVQKDATTTATLGTIQATFQEVTPRTQSDISITTPTGGTQAELIAKQHRTLANIEKSEQHPVQNGTLRGTTAPPITFAKTSLGTAIETATLGGNLTPPVATLQDETVQGAQFAITTALQGNIATMTTVVSQIAVALTKTGAGNGIASKSKIGNTAHTHGFETILAT